MAPIKNPFSRFNKVYYTDKERIIISFMERNKLEKRNQETFEKLVDEILSSFPDDNSESHFRKLQKDGQSGSVLNLLTWNGGVNKKVLDELLEFFNCY